MAKTEKMSKRDIEKLLWYLSLVEKRRFMPWLSPHFNLFCEMVFPESISCPTPKCLWGRVLLIEFSDPDGGEPTMCYDTDQECIAHFGKTPRRILESFLMRNNLARPSKVPGEWEIV